MPSPVFALNGPDFGAAADQKIAVLQNALVILGKGIGDNILKAIVVDGLMGPKTMAAVNRALSVHVGSGQAAASLRTGTLTQAQILTQISGITNTLSNEASRRGFTLTTAKVVSSAPKTSTTARTETVTIPSTSTPTVYTPPSGPTQVPGSSSGLDTIVKWSAIGLGIVVAAGAAYYMVKRRAPSMADFGGPLETFHVIRYAGQTYSGRTLEEALEAAQPEGKKLVSHWTIKAPDAGAARIMDPTAYGVRARKTFWHNADLAGAGIGATHYDRDTKMYYSTGKTKNFINVSFEPGFPSGAHIEKMKNQWVAFIYRYDAKHGFKPQMVPVGNFPATKAGKMQALQAIENARFENQG